MKQLLYRQGDILFKRVSKAPSKKNRQYRPDGVIAEGETTGHMHRVSNTKKAEVYEIDGKLMLSTPKGIRILHEEHAPVALPKGNYEVIRQREFSPKGRAIRVAD